MQGETSILVVAELHAGELHPMTLEALHAGSLVAKCVNGRISAAVLGAGIDTAVKRLQGYGLDRIYVVDDPLLSNYQSEHYTNALAEICRSATPAYILMPNTLTCVDLAPRVAWQLEAGLVTDCVAIESVEGGPVFIKPVYSGNVMAVYSAATSPFLVTLRARAFPPLQPQNSQPTEIVLVSCALSPSTRVTLVKLFEEEAEGIRLEAADRIVAGGRGIGGAEGFGHLRNLADVLGAAIGASRPPCDLGWVTPTAQVGQTGEIVAPGLYIAVGISGSTQHLAGMSGSKTIVAINADPQASIFRIADYGVVGKYEEVIPTFTEALKGMLT
jgi:electron transfer flavoprotein alpha subunit